MKVTEVIEADRKNASGLLNNCADTEKSSVRRRNWWLCAALSTMPELR